MADRGSVASRVRPCSWETPAPEPAAGALIGVEHEYQVFGADGRQLDFRALIHSIEWDGLRLDPGDANAYRLRSGLVVTADGMEAETASPPVATTAGFDDEAVAWAARGKQELERGLGPDYRLNGYSTHISVAFPAERAEDLARLYALTFGPILARLIEGPGSLGLYVRPRPGRLELCGEYVTGERLRLAALFAVGSIRACAAGEHPPRLAARLLPGQERFGYRLHRTEAFGFDSYAAAGNHAFPLVAGGSASLGDLARTAVGVACRQLIGTGPAESRAMLRAALEGPLHNPEAAEPQAARRSPGRSVFGEAVEGVQRPSFRVRPEFATWGHTVFRAERDGRSAAFCVEGASLGAFLAELRTGALDSTIERALESGSQAPALGLPGQPVRPGIYGSVADPLALVPEEIPTKAGRQGKGRPGRIGKFFPWPAVPAETAPAGRPLPAGRGQAPPAAHIPWWGVAAAAAVAAAILAGAVTLLTGGGGDSGGAAGTPRPASPSPVTETGGAGGSGASGTAGPSETPPVAATVPGSATEGTLAAGGAGASETPRPPAATATHTPTQPAEPTPAATPTATQTLSPAPTATPTRMVEPTPTATATPTRIVEPSPTPSPTPDGGPTLVPTLPPPAETASPVSTPCPPGQVCS